jgi:hypothetical protein
VGGGFGERLGPGGGPVWPASSRAGLVAATDPAGAALLQRLLGASIRVLTAAWRSGEFAFTLAGARGPDGRWRLVPRGSSLRYGAITALGLLRLPEQGQRAVLGGETAHALVGRLAKRLDDITDRGDAALVSWAAAECGHSDLPRALERLAELDQRGGPVPVVAAAWVVTALVAARTQADVERHLATARGRLLAARRAAYPHVTGGGGGYRSHVGSFADQVYPVQALARLHASSGDPAALAAADSAAAVICRAQGEAGQWWWHYDARTGGVVEGYPVYSVHQHAMAPMALLDLAEAGGQRCTEAICRGLRWLAAPPEAREDLAIPPGPGGLAGEAAADLATPAGTAGPPPPGTGEDLASAGPAATWRKVARRDPRKAVRGLRAAATRVHPGAKLAVLDRLFPPGAVDHECRPYELGWLLYTWLAGSRSWPDGGPAARGEAGTA